MTLAKQPKTFQNKTSILIFLSITYKICLRYWWKSVILYITKILNAQLTCVSLSFSFSSAFSEVLLPWPAQTPHTSCLVPTETKAIKDIKQKKKKTTTQANNNKQTPKTVVRDHVWHPLYMSLLVRHTAWRPFFLDSCECACPERFLCTFQKHSILLSSLLKLLALFCFPLLLFVPDIHSSLHSLFLSCLFVCCRLCQHLSSVWFFLYVSQNQL